MQAMNLVREGARLLLVAAIGFSTGGAVHYPQVTAAKSVTKVMNAPSTNHDYICTIGEIGMFSDIVFVACSAPAPGNISYFYSPLVGPLGDSRAAARFLNIALTAKALGKQLKLSYDDAITVDSVAAGVISCGSDKCRKPYYIGFFS